MRIEFPDDGLDEGGLRGDMPPPHSWHGCLAEMISFLLQFSSYFIYVFFLNKALLRTISISLR